MKKRLLSLFAAAAITLSLSACKPSETAQQTEETTAYNQSENIQNQALTFDDVNIIEINGKRVSLPFKVEDLGEEYSFDEVQGYQEKTPSIFYNNQCLAVVDLDNEKNIISIVFSSDALTQNDIKINNLSSNNSFEEIIDTIGVPTKQKELALIYEYDQGELYFGSEDGSLGFNYVKISLNEAPETAETTAPENTEVIYETLAEGQERDWKIEDVLKNDLEIDGIPISIPCTVEELLNTLGDGYSVNNSATICYNDKETVTSLFLGDTDNTVHGFYFKFFMIDQDSLFSDRGVLFFTKISNQNKYSNFLSQYTLPNEIILDNNKTTIRYFDEFGYLIFSFRENNLTSVFIGKSSGNKQN